MRAALLALFLAACGSSGTAPTVALSTQLADGQTCRDASVVAVELPSVEVDAGSLSFVCYLTEAPLSVSVAGLPASGSIDVLGLSADDAALYRGSFDASSFSGEVSPAITVTLYAAAAR